MNRQECAGFGLGQELLSPYFPAMARNYTLKRNSTTSPRIATSGLGPAHSGPSHAGRAADGESHEVILGPLLR